MEAITDVTVAAVKPLEISNSIKNVTPAITTANSNNTKSRIHCNLTVLHLVIFNNNNIRTEREKR